MVLLLQQRSYLKDNKVAATEMTHIHKYINIRLRNV